MSERRVLAGREECGAWARSRGRPCQAPCVPGSRRCRLHGGLSTGARTEAGRERLRAVWQRWGRVAALCRWQPSVGKALAAKLRAGGTNGA
jgi:hypothetical protein